MKEFLITVNGKTYEVQVEEVGEGTKAAPLPPAQKPTPKIAPIPNATPAQKPKVEPLSSNKAAGKITVKSPMPGTIVKINVNVGDTVKSDTLLCILEAMKMENEIFAGTDGVVASVNTTKGASVNSGDVLFSIN